MKSNSTKLLHPDNVTSPLSKEQLDAISREIRMILHAGRDCLRNQGMDTSIVRFSDGYYGEALGIMRALTILGHGYMGSINVETPELNVRFWLEKLENEVLDEENFGGSNECDFCVERWGKDGAGRSRSDMGISESGK